MSRNKREGKFAGKYMGINFRMGVDEVWSYYPVKPCREEARYRNTRRIYIAFNIKYKFRDKNEPK